MKYLSLLAVASPLLALAWEQPVLAPGRALIFPDDSQIASRTNVVRVFHPAVCDRAPVLEGGFVYGTVNPRSEGGWRMWYNTGWEVCIADSEDGKKWTRPTNNVVFKGYHSPAVLLDAFEKDPARRYKMVGAVLSCPKFGVVDRQQTGYYVSTSSDGVHWQGKRRALPGWDTVAMAQHPETGEIFIYHKNLQPLPGRDEERRFVLVSSSKDFDHWSTPVLALAPDEVDDNAWADNPDQRTDIYNMPVFSYAGGFIGFPTIFRITSRFPMGPDGKKDIASPFILDDGPIDVQMATSGDGVLWKRTSGRRTMIARGAPGTFDCGQVPGLAGGSLLTRGEETSIYYYAINKLHGEIATNGGGTRISIGRAVWRRWGFASLGSSTRGSFVTKPIRLGTADLRVNAKPCPDPRDGASWLRVTVQSPNGTALAVSKDLSCDGTLIKPIWKQGAPPRDRPVRLRFDFHAMSVYAVECL